MVTKDNKDDRKRAEKALEAAGFKVAKVVMSPCPTLRSKVLIQIHYLQNYCVTLSKYHNMGLVTRKSVFGVSDIY